MERLRYYEADKRMKRAAMIFSIIVATFVTGIVMHKEVLNAKAQMQEKLADEVLRFHVLANSDSEEDQALKMKVKEAVLSYLEEEMPAVENAEKTREWIRRHTDALEKVSENIIRAEGYDYAVSAAVTTCWFPDKTYGEVTFPQGNYKALRIEIGEAKGQNWWCVLYPGLCFRDAVHAVVPDKEKQKLKSILSEEEYMYLTSENEVQVVSYFLENILTF